MFYYRDSAGEVEPGFKPVPGVEIDVDGDLLVDATTGTDGLFVLADQGGSFTVTPLGRFGDSQGEMIGAVTPLDATFVSHHRVGIIELSPNQQIAADVTGNGSISSLDAVYVAKYSIQLINRLPVAEATGSVWLYFRCDSYLGTDDHDCTTPIYEHDPLLAPESDDFYALAYGDVNGNWAPAGRAQSFPDGSAEADAAWADYWGVIALAGPRRPYAPIGSTRSGPAPRTSFGTRDSDWEPVPNGRLRRIVISVQEGQSIEALDLTLRYDPRTVEVRGLEVTDLTRDFALTTHDTGSVFRGSAWTVFPLGESGDVLVLTILERPTATETKPLRLEILADEQAFSLEIRGRAPRAAP
ncbi:MAG: hypothetical protein DRJ50_11775 [Actinobacteria bacterium]|nr:MAG: hypothetical protein DRJ50_11775 [Actinomycetota bacterium]